MRHIENWGFPGVLLRVLPVCRMRCRLCRRQGVDRHIYDIFLSVRIVGRERNSLRNRLLRRFDTQPIEGFDDIGFCARDETLRVGIFDAENHVSAVLFGEEVVIEGGTYTADVQGSRGTWGETHTDFSFCCFHRICRVFVLRL